MNPRLLGAFGEQEAARFLRKKGYEILSSNIYIGAGELDIVAMQGNMLCFVEVKTRRDGGLLNPAEAVGVAKRGNIKSAASAYMSKFDMQYDFRYDIIEVLVDEADNIVSINHIENAFDVL